MEKNCPLFAESAVSTYFDAKHYLKIQKFYENTLKLKKVNHFLKVTSDVCMNVFFGSETKIAQSVLNAFVEILDDSPPVRH